MKVSERLAAQNSLRADRVNTGQGSSGGTRARRLRILLVDLNNFASFPTLAIGLLVAALRDAGHIVDVLCPLAHDVPGTVRERRETFVDHIRRRIHLSSWRPLLAARDAARSLRDWRMQRPHPIVLRETAQALDAGPDVILLSAYLQHYRTVVEVGLAAERQSVPLLLGGPMFNLGGVTEAWRATPGLTAIVGAESEPTVAALVEAAVTGGDLLAFDGVVLPDGRRSRPAPPLRNLDATPIPDFTDFPWDRYPFRIVPVMTGRGCQWNRCAFCSDVVSVNGRTFRTRSVDSVMVELREQARRHATTNFLFIDLKLNSNPKMMRGISENIQRAVPGAQWIGTVHVDTRKENGLSRTDLRAAVASGMRRISFGLESGSQRLLDAMAKGSTVEANAEFIRNSHEAGLSVRCTMFRGYPGETADDMQSTADFLEAHERCLDRVRFSEFTIYEGTPIHEALLAKSPEYATMQLRSVEPRMARSRGAEPQTSSRAYRDALQRALGAVFRINRKTVRHAARAFDGLM